MHLRILALLVVVGALACSSSTSTTQRKTDYSRDLITSEEIRQGSYANAYDLISRLRPHWLRSRGSRSIKYEDQATYPVVYLDGSNFGDINSLSTIPPQNINEIQYLGPGDATTHFGLNHPSGAILIKLY